MTWRYDWLIFVLWLIINLFKTINTQKSWIEIMLDLMLMLMPVIEAKEKYTIVHCYTFVWIRYRWKILYVTSSLFTVHCKAPNALDLYVHCSINNSKITRKSNSMSTDYMADALTTRMCTSLCLNKAEFLIKLFFIWVHSYQTFHSCPLLPSLLVFFILFEYSLRKFNEGIMIYKQ